MPSEKQRSVDLLLAHLPAPPCRILEVGTGLGTAVSTLAERGYIVTRISPNAKQLALTKQYIQNNVALKCVTYEAFSAPVASYDVILFAESSQHLKNLTLFNKAYHLLTESGLILIADEFSLQLSAKYATQYLPSLTYTLAQALRCGFKFTGCDFKFTKKAKLSTQSSTTDVDILKVISRHQAKLLAKLNLEPLVLEELLTFLHESQQKYPDDHSAYTLFRFTKIHPPRWKITEVTATDKDAIKQLFGEVFKPEQMTDELWEWKYGQGRGLGIAAWQNGQMIAHYGAISRTIHYFGKPKLAVQIADVMVANKQRAVFTRQGVFFLIMTTFSESYVGYSAKTWIGYGFPNKRAMQLAQRLGLYATVGKMVELRWQPVPGKPYLWSRIRHLQAEDLNKNKLIINKLWQQMASSLTTALVGIRDFAYIQHRYLLHPHHHYELLLVTRRFTGQALGIAIIQRQQEVCRIMDFIGDLKYIPKVIQQVRRLAGLWGMKQVTVWITTNFLTVFSQQEVEQYDLEISIPHNIWSQCVPTEEIDGHWWLMSGDTDFL